MMNLASKAAWAVQELQGNKTVLLWARNVEERAEIFRRFRNYGLSIKGSTASLFAHNPCYIHVVTRAAQTIGHKYDTVIGEIPKELQGHINTRVVPKKHVMTQLGEKMDKSKRFWVQINAAAVFGVFCVLIGTWHEVGIVTLLFWVAGMTMAIKAVWDLING